MMPSMLWFIFEFSNESVRKIYTQLKFSLGSGSALRAGVGSGCFSCPGS